MSKTLTYVVSHYLSQLQRLLLIDLETDFLGAISFSLCKTFIMQFLHPSTQEHKWQDISCTDPQVHLQTRSCVRLESLWARLSSGVKAPDDAKQIEQRLLFNSALQWPQIPVLCFQPFGFRLLQIILEEQLRGQHCFCETMLLGDQMHVTTLPTVIPVMCLPAGQTDGMTHPAPSPQLSQQCRNPASNCFLSRSAPLLPAGVWRKTGPGLRRLHSAARSQHGGTSYRCMPCMPKRAVPMVWVTATWVKRG